MNGSADYFARKKVAIVGSGCAGIAALWALNKTYHDVYLYEAADRLGGHTNTVQFKKGKYTTAVDTGFIALNTITYRELSMALVALPFLLMSVCSKFSSLPRQDWCENRTDGTLLQCFARPGGVRMGWPKSNLPLLPKKKRPILENVENDL